MTKIPRGRVFGDAHHAAKFLVEDIALIRLVAADQALPLGMLTALANERGATVSALGMALRGEKWSAMTDPAPVTNHQVIHAAPSRPLCPACGRRKYQRQDCAHRFHSIDHRTLASSRAARR
jgi:hypothetical protein